MDGLSVGDLVGAEVTEVGDKVGVLDGDMVGS